MLTAINFMQYTSTTLTTKGKIRMVHFQGWNRFYWFFVKSRCVRFGVYCRLRLGFVRSVFFSLFFYEDNMHSHSSRAATRFHSVVDAILGMCMCVGLCDMMY